MFFPTIVGIQVNYMAALHQCGLFYRELIV